MAAADLLFHLVGTGNAPAGPAICRKGWPPAPTNRPARRPRNWPVTRCQQGSRGQHDDARGHPTRSGSPARSPTRWCGCRWSPRRQSHRHVTWRVPPTHQLRDRVAGGTAVVGAVAHPGHDTATGHIRPAVRRHRELPEHRPRRGPAQRARETAGYHVERPERLVRRGPGQRRCHGGPREGRRLRGLSDHGQSFLWDKWVTAVTKPTGVELNWVRLPSYLGGSRLRYAESTIEAGFRGQFTPLVAGEYFDRQYCPSWNVVSVNHPL